MGYICMSNLPIGDQLRLGRLTQSVCSMVLMDSYVLPVFGYDLLFLIGIIM